MTPTLPNGEAPKGQHAAAPRPAPVDPPAVAEAFRQFRSRSPQEALGLSDQSGLLMASVQAGVVILVLFAALTIGPYFIDRSNSSASTNPTPAPEKHEVEPAPQPSTPSNSKTAPSPSTPGPDASSKQPVTGNPTAVGKTPPKGKDIVDVLGESGTKTVSPKINPLEKGGDDLLKDIK